MTTRTIDAADLARRASSLPACIVREATADDLDLAGFFWYPTNQFDFGERLVMIGGLVVLALYVDRIIRGFGTRDALLEDHLKAVLFERGYDRGLACASIEASQLVLGDLGNIASDETALAWFVMAKPADTGNLVRSLGTREPTEVQLASILNRLSFLSKLEFDPNPQMPTVLFGGTPIELRPFLYWDGTALWRLKRILQGSEPTILYTSTMTMPEQTVEMPLDAAVKAQLRRVARVLGLGLLDDAPQLDDTTSRSFIPLFADSYPMLERLVRKVYDKSEWSTKRELWVKPLMQGAMSEEINAKVDDKVFVTNAMIKRCMDADPVTVVTEYLAREEADQPRYLTELIHDPAERSRLQTEIEYDVTRYEERMQAFYCRPHLTGYVRQQTHRYKARLFAQKIVSLFGLQVVDYGPLEDLSEYQQHVHSFQECLASPDQDDPNRAAITTRGLLECVKSTERLLQVLLLFYKALLWYRHDCPDGLDVDGMERLRAYRLELEDAGLGTLIGKLRKLGGDNEIRARVELLLRRDGIWPDGTEAKIFRHLDELNQWRKPAVHYKDHPPAPDPPAVVHNVIELLDWLAGPASTRKPFAGWRIFPAVLTLSVVSTNSCGISSLKYVLKVDKQEQPITLYTHQRLDVAAGAFLGLPNMARSLPDLWVNPVLLPLRAIGGQP